MSGESDGVVCCRSSPHICPVLLGSTSEQFSWERDMQVFFFFLLSSPQTDASSLSRARQQTDGRVRCMKRGKRFVQAQAVRLGERRVLGEVFKQSGKNKPVVFVSPSQREWVTWGRRGGNGGQNYRFMTFCTIQIRKHTCWTFTSSGVFLFKSSKRNDRSCCQCRVKLRFIFLYVVPLSSDDVFVSADTSQQLCRFNATSNRFMFCVGEIYWS